MTITVSVPDALARQAAAQGLSVETYVEHLVAQAVREPKISLTGCDSVLAGTRHKRRVGIFVSCAKALL